MANQTTDPTTAGPGGVMFEVERLARNEPGLFEVRGRWFGIRGRRFVRPALTLVVDGSEQRWLADLEHKPWSAEDGEEWMATFPLDVEVDTTANLELSVAPDITVKLGDGRGSPTKRRRLRSSAAILRAPRVRSDGDGHGPSLTERAQEIERLNAKIDGLVNETERERSRRDNVTKELERERGRAAQAIERERARVAAANEEFEREHARRAAAGQALEDERNETLRLRAQVGQLRAELDLARTGQAEAESSAGELEAARRALTEERAHAEHSAADLDQTLRAVNEELAHTRQALDRKRAEAARSAAELAEAERALAQEREQAQLLRAQLIQARAAVAAPETREFRAVSESPAPPEPEGRRTERAQHEWLKPEPARREPARSEPARREAPRQENRSRDIPRPDRPLNPSLRHRTYWLGRVLALLFILAVIAAVILVLKSTVLPHIV